MVLIIGIPNAGKTTYSARFPKVVHFDAIKGRGIKRFDNIVEMVRADNSLCVEGVYEKAKEHKGELVLIAIGPLTNVARTIIMHPDIRTMLKQIVMMGGSTEAGNVTPYAEFNFLVDPPAAKVVFESGIPLAMAGLNVTLKTGISFDFIADLARESGSKIGGMLNELVHGYSDVKINKEGDRSSVVHDAIAVAYVIDPTKCETEEKRIEIQTERFLEGAWGQSKVVDGEPNCTVINDIDMDYYRELYRNTVDYFSDLN